MLGNVIGGFILLLVGISLMPTIMQELELSYCDNINNTDISTEKPLGSTDSFGGGGSSNFGGYNGEVKKSWDYKEYSLLKRNNESIFVNKGECIERGSSKAQLVGLITLFFALAIATTAIAINFQVLRNSGLVEGDL